MTPDGLNRFVMQTQSRRKSHEGGAALADTLVAFVANTTIAILSIILVLASDVLSWLGMGILVAFIIVIKLLASPSTTRSRQKKGLLIPPVHVELSKPSRLRCRTPLPPGGRLVRLSHGFTHYILEEPNELKTSKVVQLPLVVLVHGFVGSSSYFEYLKNELLLAGRRVLRFDLYGRGHSDPCTHTPHTEMLFAGQLAELLFALGFNHDEPIDVLGYSMGAVVAAKFAATYGDSKLAGGRTDEDEEAAESGPSEQNAARSGVRKAAGGRRYGALLGSGQRPSPRIRSLVLVAPAGTLAVRVPFWTRLFLRLPLLPHLVALFFTRGQALASVAEWEHTSSSSADTKSHLPHYVSVQRERREPALPFSMRNTLQHFPLASRAGEDIFAALGHIAQKSSNSSRNNNVDGGNNDATLQPKNEKAANSGQAQSSNLPCLVIWGAKDRTTPIAGAARLASLLPTAQFKIYDTAMHALPIERSEDVGRDVVEWWGELAK